MRLFFSSAVLLTIVSSVFGETCPEIAKGEKKFIVYKEKVNWFQALFNCSSQGMSLATIESQQEQDMIVSLLKPSPGPNSYIFTRLWLGGADLHKEKKFIWFSTNQPINYQNFKECEPNNWKYWTGEMNNCVQLVQDSVWNYKWSVDPCGWGRHFACEYFE